MTEPITQTRLFPGVLWVLEVRTTSGPPLTAQSESTQCYWLGGLKPILNPTVYLAGLLNNNNNIYLNK